MCEEIKMSSTEGSLGRERASLELLYYLTSALKLSTLTLQNYCAVSKFQERNWLIYCPSERLPYLLFMCIYKLCSYRKFFSFFIFIPRSIDHIEQPISGRDQLLFLFIYLWNFLSYLINFSSFSKLFPVSNQIEFMKLFSLEELLQ